MAIINMHLLPSGISLHCHSRIEALVRASNAAILAIWFSLRSRSGAGRGAFSSFTICCCFCSSPSHPFSTTLLGISVPSSIPTRAGFQFGGSGWYSNPAKPHAAQPTVSPLVVTAFITAHFPGGRESQVVSTSDISAAWLVLLESSLRRVCVSIEKAREEIVERVGMSVGVAGWSEKN